MLVIVTIRPVFPDPVTYNHYCTSVVFYSAILGLDITLSNKTRLSHISMAWSHGNICVANICGKFFN